VFTNIELDDEGEYSCKISNVYGIEITKCQIELQKPRVVLPVVEEPVVEPKKVKINKSPIRKTPSDVQVTKREPSVKDATKPVAESAPAPAARSTPTPAARSTPTPAARSTPTRAAEVPAKQSPTETKSEPAQEVVQAVAPVKLSKEDRASFSRHLKSQNLVEGEPLILESEVTCKQPFEVVWLRNGKEIPENPDFLRERFDNLFKLTVNEIFPEDSGVFSAELFCEATNQTILSSCSVVVKGREENELDPKFDLFPSSINVDEGHEAKINCVVSGTQPVSSNYYLFFFVIPNKVNIY
jgi:hypothetical protein